MPLNKKPNQTKPDCFVDSQFFSVVRHARCFDLGSKRDRLYVERDDSLVVTPELSFLSMLVKELYVYIYLLIHLLATGMLSSWEELCIYAYVVACNSEQNWYLITLKGW